jgi:lysozyme family protein
MTTARIIDDIIRREGAFVDDPADRGGATKFGITAATLGRWRQHGRPATREEVRDLSIEDARAIYEEEYVRAPGFLAIEDDALRALLVDDAVLSGPAAAIRALQRCVGARVDGVLGPRTLARVKARDPKELQHSLAKERVVRLATLVQHDPAQLRFLVGWVRRTLEFIDTAA